MKDTDRTFIEAAAKATYDYSIVDEGKWLVGLLDSELGVSSGLVEFMYKEFNALDQRTKRDADMFVRLHFANVALAEKLQILSNTTLNTKNLLMSYRKLHRALVNIDGHDNITDTIRLQLKEVSVAELLLKLENTADNKFQLALAYLSVALTNSHEGEEFLKKETGSKISDYFDKARSILEILVLQNTEKNYQRELGWLYCAYYYNHRSSPYELELDFTRKGVALIEQLYNDAPCAENALDLAEAYDYLAEAYRIYYYKKKDVSKSKECIMKSIQLIEQHYTELEWIDATSSLAGLYFRLAFCSHETRESEKSYLKMIELRESLFHELLSPEAGMDLAWSYNRVAIYYRNKLDMPAALSMQKKCSAVYRKLLLMYHRSVYIDKLSRSEDEIAEGYMALGNIDSLKKAASIYKKNLEFLKQETDRTFFGYYYKGIANAYYKIGENEYWRKALPYYCCAFEDYLEPGRKNQFWARDMLQMYSAIEEICQKNRDLKSSIADKFLRYTHEVKKIKEKMNTYPAV